MSKQENTVVLRVPVAIAPIVRKLTLEYRIEQMEQQSSKLKKELSELETASA